jgi:hypothetical protein
MQGRKSIGGDNELFHYCSELEHALTQYYGKKPWHGSANLFHDYRHVRKAVLAASRAIRARLRGIDRADDRFLFAMSTQLEWLDRLTRRLNDKGENLIEMLGCLLEIIARLLGYDWHTGRPNRQIAYSQTLDQIHLDDWRMQPQASRRESGYCIEKENRRMEELVATLFDEGFRAEQIARMLRISQARVKDRLVRCGKLSRDKSIYDQKPDTSGQPHVNPGEVNSDGKSNTVIGGD